MTDLSITAASIAPAANAQIEYGASGEAIGAGKSVYFDSSLQQWLLADANHATAAKRRPTGISLNASAAAGQKVAVQKGGDLNLGATLVAGARYYCSATAGGICPEADLATGMEVSLIGIATSTSNLKTLFANTQVVTP